MREYSIGIVQDLEPVLPAHAVAQMMSAGKLRCYERQGLLYRQGEPADEVHLLLSGSVKSYIVNAAGNESVLRIHLPQSILGLTALASAPWRDASAVALEPSEAVAVPRASMLALVQQQPDIAGPLIQLLVDRMRDFHFRVGVLQAQSVEQRLARALLALSRSDPRRPAPEGEVGVSLTHQDLADMIFTRRQTVTQILGRFTAAGYISRRGRQLCVTDPTGLAALDPG